MRRASSLTRAISAPFWTRNITSRTFIRTPVPRWLSTWSLGAEQGSASQLTPRQVALLEDQVLQALKKVQDPYLHEPNGKENGNIVSSNMVNMVEVDQETGRTTIVLDLPSSVWPAETQLWERVREALRQVEGLDADRANIVSKTRSKKTRKKSLKAQETTLDEVNKVIAVSSCKGGVGKSTVAVNLAMMLKTLGARVGIFDADVYGPSIPQLLSPEDPQVFKLDNGRINPVVYEGMNTMSYGYVAPRNKRGERGGALMRGPMVSNVVKQLANFTEWGELDYLVVDMPPGTGDVNITVGQNVPIDAGVVVTTPHKLSYTDVIKGIDLFQEMKVPVAAVVENMSFFDTEEGKRYFPFGKGHTDKLIERSALAEDDIFKFPITQEISESSNDARPFISSDNMDSAVSQIYRRMAEHIVVSIAKREEESGTPLTTVSFQSGKGIVVQSLSRRGASLKYIHPAELRRHCRCAACVDEATGEQILRAEDVPDTVEPTQITPQGNYGVAVQWSDGHTSSLYSYEKLHSLAQESPP